MIAQDKIAAVAMMLEIDPVELAVALNPTERLLSYKDAAKILSISKMGIHRMITRGELDRVPVGKTVRVKYSQISAIMAGGNS